jgi:putative tryptophan/tyrosine transport system substrate-binding protein
MNWLMPALQITLAAALAAAVPAAAEAPQSGRVYRLAVLGHQNTPLWDGFRQGLRNAGYVEGRNVTIQWRWSEGFPDRLPGLARELVALSPDVIVASGTQAIIAAKSATTTIPIVMTVITHPQELGLVQSLSRPGGNITGLSVYPVLFTAKRLELLKEIVPKASVVAFLWNSTSPGERLQIRDMAQAADAAGVTVRLIDATSPDQLPGALAAVAASRADALIVVGNPMNFGGRQLIADFARRNRIPTMCTERLFVQAGCLVSYAPSFIDMFRQAAGYVDRILKGAKPGDLPVEQPARFEVAINAGTARALGVTMPESVIMRADLVVE